jgi:hypothetical protein
LVAFGADSAIEVASAFVLLRRLAAEASDADQEDVEIRERRALWLVGITFLLLSAYIVIRSSVTICFHRAPEGSVAGIVVTVLALVAMPILARSKLSVGRAIESRALVADAKETLACAWLAAITLVGLVLNAVFSWWWADPIAALLLVPFLVHKGKEASSTLAKLEGRTAMIDRAVEAWATTLGGGLMLVRPRTTLAEGKEPRIEADEGNIEHTIVVGVGGAGGQKCRGCRGSTHGYWAQQLRSNRWGSGPSTPPVLDAAVPGACSHFVPARMRPRTYPRAPAAPHVALCVWSIAGPPGPERVHLASIATDGSAGRPGETVVVRERPLRRSNRVALQTLRVKSLHQ